jgi:glucose-6-phosphate isomerase
VTYIATTPDLTAPALTISSTASIIHRAVSGSFSTPEGMKNARAAARRLRLALNAFERAVCLLETEQ